MSMFDLAIIGGGPAGVAAAVYAARKAMKTAVITRDFGGQSIVSDSIQNWVGEVSISGIELARKFKEHVKAQENIELVTNDTVVLIKETDKEFVITTKKERVIKAKTILVTAGASRRKLGVPGEETFNGRGVAFCATCDAPLFKDKAVAVVGGGNSGLEAAIDLLPYATHIYIIHRNGMLKGDAINQNKVIGNPKVTIIGEAEVIRIEGQSAVSGITHKDRTSGIESTTPLEGVFVEIGSIPNSDLVKDLVTINEQGEIIVDPKTQKTIHPGIWAAGDVADGLYKQNNISAGDAIKAVLNVYDYLQKKVGE